MNPSAAASLHTARPARPPFPKAFYLTLFATALFAMGLTMLFPIMPLYITDELGVAEHWVGTATLSFALSSVTLRIPAGTLSDRRGRRVIMLIGAGMGVGGAMLTVLSINLPIFLAGRLLTGASMAVFTTAGKALAVDLTPAIRRGEAMGLYNAAFSIASVISPMIGEGLKNAAGFRSVFVLSGFLAAGALALTLALPNTRPERGAVLSAGGDVKATLRERGSWAAILTMIGMGTILAVMFTFYPLLAERREFYADAPRVLSAVAIGFGLSIWAMVDTVVEPLAGSVSDRLGRLPVMVPGLVITLAGLYILSRATNTLSAYLAIAVLSAGWGIVHAMADSVSQDALPSALRGMGAAVLYLCFDLSVGINAQVLAGLIDGRDFSAFFAAAASNVLIFGMIGLLLSNRLVSYEQRAGLSTAGD